MNEVKTHYSTHLAAHYSWMLGERETQIEAFSDLLTRRGLDKGKGQTAWDLGAGTGLQSLALARKGYQVHALDFSAEMLAQMGPEADQWGIQRHQADLTDSQSYALPSADLLVCMQDTLLHLPALSDLETLFHQGYAQSQPEAAFLLSFRDLSQALSGKDRFILLRAEADRILSCFLEYLPDQVMIHDIIQTREKAGWEQRIHAYPKLRAGWEDIQPLWEKAGWQSQWQEKRRGMWYVHLRKG
ncbi:MAG: class I SAM-dependent methyltransferase [Bacteroidota bacterium]